jgi:hypothetical protein
MKKIILCALIISGCSQYQPYSQPYGGYNQLPPYGQRPVRGQSYGHSYAPVSRTFCVNNPNQFNEIGSGIGQIVSSFQSSGGYGSAYLIGNLLGSILDQRSNNQDCMQYGEYSWDKPDDISDDEYDRSRRRNIHRQDYYDEYSD